MDEERSALARARGERILEFQAGRHCAREAMSRLGLIPRAVSRAADRAPVWPEGVVGSITHTRRGGRGWCGAAVARATEILSLGLDAEMDDPLDEGLFPRVLTESERAVVDALVPAEQGRHAKLVFSAKECAYKCQYPRSRQFLEFHDVEVTVDPGRGTFAARLLRDAGPFLPGHEWQGRFLREQGVVVTAITVPR